MPPVGAAVVALALNTCGTTGSGEINQPLLEQVECNTQILSTKPCPAGSEYPRKTTVEMHALPKAKKLPTMFDTPWPMNS